MDQQKSNFRSIWISQDQKGSTRSTHINKINQRINISRSINLIWNWSWSFLIWSEFDLWSMFLNLIHRSNLKLIFDPFWSDLSLIFDPCFWVWYMDQISNWSLILFDLIWVWSLIHVFEFDTWIKSQIDLWSFLIWSDWSLIRVDPDQINISVFHCHEYSWTIINIYINITDSIEYLYQYYRLTEIFHCHKYS